MESPFLKKARAPSNPTTKQDIESRPLSNTTPSRRTGDQGGIRLLPALRPAESPFQPQAKSRNEASGRHLGALPPAYSLFAVAGHIPVAGHVPGKHTLARNCPCVRHEQLPSEHTRARETAVRNRLCMRFERPPSYRTRSSVPLTSSHGRHCRISFENSTKRPKRESPCSGSNLNTGRLTIIVCQDTTVDENPNRRHPLLQAFLPRGFGT